jgi:hypothetical protein
VHKIAHIVYFGVLEVGTRVLQVPIGTIHRGLYTHYGFTSLSWSQLLSQYLPQVPL